MIRIAFPPQDIKKIKQLRDDDPYPRVRRRSMPKVFVNCYENRTDNSWNTDHSGPG